MPTGIHTVDLVPRHCIEQTSNGRAQGPAPTVELNFWREPCIAIYEMDCSLFEKSMSTGIR